MARTEEMQIVLENEFGLINLALPVVERVQRVGHMSWASVAYQFMSKCQENFEIITGNMLTEAENHFYVGKMNSSPGYFMVYRRV